MTAATINLIAGTVSAGLIVSSVLKLQDGRWPTAAIRFAIGIWILYLAVEAVG